MTTTSFNSNVVVAVLNGDNATFTDVNLSRLILQPFAAVPGSPFDGGVPYVYTAPSGITGLPSSTSLYLGFDELVSSATFSRALSDTLTNLGGGAKIYSPTVQGLRTITSSDASLIVTETTDTVNLAAPPILLNSAGGTVSLVNDGTGPILAVKGLSAGAGISLDSSDPTKITIGTTIALGSAGGVESLVNNGSVPNLAIKGLTAASGISLTSAATAVTIANSTTLGSAGGTVSLVGNGTGPGFTVKGLTAGTGIGLSSSTTNVTISSSITLGSAGGAVSLVNTGTGANLLVKGLTAGNNIALDTTDPTRVTISVIEAAKWAQVSTNIIGTIDTDTVLLHGVGNTAFSSNTSSAILASRSSTFTDSPNIVNCGILASSGCTIQSTALAGQTAQCAIIGSTNSSLNYCGNGCVTVACSGGSTGDLAGNVSTTAFTLAGSSGNHLFDKTGPYNTILSTQDCKQEGERTSYSSIIGCSACTISTTASTGIGTYVSMMASNACTTAVGGAGTLTFVCASENLNCGTSSRSFFSSSGNAVTVNLDDYFYVKKPNGAAFYSNTGGTIGVTLAAGGSSWATVSDVALKENLTVLDYGTVLNKLDTLNVYSYNYIGNPAAQRCFGTTAQEWHGEGTFKCDEYECATGELDAEGNPITVTKCGKDCLVIELQDQIGVLMASVKALYARIKVLEEPTPVPV